ncbi:MAG: MFS transporter [Acidobacteriota bacterium]|nr:MFS transporter [Acidobacteriota bacterium]
MATSPPPSSPRYAWYVVFVLMVIYVFAFIDRQILSMMIGDLKEGLNLQRDWHAGFLMGPAFAIFYTLFGIPFGRLADTHNRRLLIAMGFGLWSLLTAGCGIAKNFWQMALMRVGVGVGEASLSPSAYSLIADFFPREKLGRATAFYGMGIYFGSGLAYLIGGRAITYVKETAAWQLPILGTVEPWQKVFFLVGLPGLLVIPLLMLTVREPIRKGLWKGSNSASKEYSASVPIFEVVLYMRQNSKTIITHNVGFALLAFSGLGTTAWLPEIFRRVYGWEMDQFGLVYGSIFALFGALGIYGGGYFADLLSQKGYRDAKIRVGFLSAWIWFPVGIAFPLVPDPNLAMLLVVPVVFLAAMPGALGAASIQEVMPNNMRGQASAIYLFVVNMIGLALGPVILAMLTDYIFTGSNYGVEGIRYSLLSLTVTAHLFATLLLWKCMYYFRDSMDRLEEVTEQ